MRNPATRHFEDSADHRRVDRDGHRRFLATLLMATGAMHLLFSVLATLVLAGTAQPIITPGGLALPFAERGFTTMAAMASVYTTAQIWLGWVLGPLTMLAAWFMMRGRHRGFLTAIAWCNLAVFPLGTTIGILVLIGLDKSPAARVQPG